MGDGSRLERRQDDYAERVGAGEPEPGAPRLRGVRRLPPRDRPAVDRPTPTDGLSPLERQNPAALADRMDRDLERQREAEQGPERYDEAIREALMRDPKPGEHPSPLVRARGSSPDDDINRFLTPDDDDIDPAQRFLQGFDFPAESLDHAMQQEMLRDPKPGEHPSPMVRAAGRSPGSVPPEARSLWSEDR